MIQGPYAALFNLAATASSGFTILAWVRIPQAVVNGNLASNPICGNLRTGGTSSGYGGWLLDIEHNVPTFQVYNNTGAGTTTPVSLGSSISPDIWYLMAGVQDVVNKQLLVCLISGLATSPTVVSNFVNITLASQQSTSSTGACTIGQNANVVPTPPNAYGFIESVGIIGAALSSTQLQNLFSIGLKGGL